ncbi:hypothetical protein C8R43DRAFT_1193197, partial [Mycena crocata]
VTSYCRLFSALVYLSLPTSYGLLRRLLSTPALQMVLCPMSKKEALNPSRYLHHTANSANMPADFKTIFGGTRSRLDWFRVDDKPHEQAPFQRATWVIQNGTAYWKSWCDSLYKFAVKFVTVKWALDITLDWTCLSVQIRPSEQEK